jgi:regulator of sirC expression with transglutaminase-like and TPR domain
MRSFVSMLYNAKKIDTLLELLDDPDPFIYKHVKEELLRLGATAIPHLEDSQLFPNQSDLFSSRLETLIIELQFSKSRQSIEEWIQNDEKSLLNASIILETHRNPDVIVSDIYAKIQTIRKQIWLELNPKMTSFEQIKVFNRVFYGILGFKGIDDYSHAKNAVYLDDVLQHRTGTPLALSILYSILAQSLDLPVYAVQLPNHTILAYLDNLNLPFRSMIKNKYGVLFYINPTNSGSLHDTTAVEHYLETNNASKKRCYFEPCANSNLIEFLIDEMLRLKQSDLMTQQLRVLKNSFQPSRNNFVANI